MRLWALQERPRSPSLYSLGSSVASDLTGDGAKATAPAALLCAASVDTGLAVAGGGGGTNGEGEEGGRPAKVPRLEGP